MVDPVEDIDSLQGLEERILKAVGLIQKLREENLSLREQLQESEAATRKAVAALESIQSASSNAEKEVELLRAERKQVKNRIEKLLGQMDRLAEA
ncbi:MAG: cell division protein ZapB [Acidobacteriaceae bacterium]|nr:cell division protein ZapB [Acidobacteriaceae bacterium]